MPIGSPDKDMHKQLKGIHILWKHCKFETSAESLVKSTQSWRRYLSSDKTISMDQMLTENYWMHGGADKVYVNLSTRRCFPATPLIRSFFVVLFF